MSDETMENLNNDDAIIYEKLPYGRYGKAGKCDKYLCDETGKIIENAIVIDGKKIICEEVKPI